MDILEGQIRETVNQVVARGRLTVRVALHAGASNQAARMHLNVPLAKAYFRELARLSRQLKLSGPVTLDHLVRAPGVFQTDEDLVVEEDFWPVVSKALSKALAQMLNMRQREGGHLSQDLVRRIGTMRKAVDHIQKQAPQVSARYRQQLLERIKSAGLTEIGLEDDRLQKEVVYFADRSDISEELTRLQSHFKQFEDCRKSVEPVGRTLDFLAQEFNREVNTCCSKSNDLELTQTGLEMKNVVEQFREQVQNLE
jgi:uncharacterized protein (TIGR00255 family)